MFPSLFFVWFKVISIYQKQISTLQRQKIIRKSKVFGMEKNPDLLASIVLKKYSESKEYGTISETGDNKKENSNGRPKGKAFFACNVIVYAPVWFSGSRGTVDWEALQLSKNNETDTFLLEWLYWDKCIKGLKAPNWSSPLIVTWVFILLGLGVGMRERESLMVCLEWFNGKG